MNGTDQGRKYKCRGEFIILKQDHSKYAVMRIAHTFEERFLSKKLQQGRVYYDFVKYSPMYEVQF